MSQVIEQISVLIRALLKFSGFVGKAARALHFKEMDVESINWSLEDIHPD